MVDTAFNVACNFPVAAWQPPTGRLIFRAPPIGRASEYSELKVPCGKCLGCSAARARAWAYRCRLEWATHQEACWATLTYSDRYLPATLERPALAGYLKRLRARETGRVVRFFACGEYGERTKRPHYHVILFGLSRHTPSISEAWGLGHVRVDPLSPNAINYVAGYVAKKIGQGDFIQRDRVDPTTGEVYRYQPPFLQMSRRPGIGAKAREFTSSWKDFAVDDGMKLPVPRYLHEAWRRSVDEEAVKAHKELRQRQAADRPWNGAVREAILAARFSSSSEKRKL